MVKFTSIQPLSFEIIPEAEGLQVQYERLALPTGFKEDVLRAFQQQKPKAKTIPIDDLNRLVRLVLPDVYSIDSYANRDGYNWLRAMPKSIDPKAIRIILNAWMHAHNFSAVSLPDLNDLQWQPEIAELDNWQQHPNGTTKAGDNATYDLLPNLLANRIVAKPLEVGKHPLFFYQVAKDPSSKGVELMSWPPLEHEDYKQQSWFYSYYIQIAVATTPFESMPQINVYVGIRRWVSTYYSFLPQERLSVHIRAKLPYLSGVHSAHNFQVATVKIHPHQDGEWRLRWSDKLPEMLQFLNLDPKLPDPEQLRKSPVDPLKRQDLPNIALIYSNRLGNPNHEVAPGVSPGDRYDLIQALKPHWSDLLTLVEPLKKVNKSRNGWRDPFHSKTTDYRQRWARLHQQHKNAPIAIEVYYQDDTNRDAMLDTLAELLGLNSPICAIHDLDGLSLTVSTHLIGAIGSELKRTEGDNLHDVVEQRRQSVVTVLGKTEVATIALVEILNKEQYVTKTDPKQALRYSFAHTGRLTQFFNPMNTKEKEAYMKRIDNDSLHESTDDELENSRLPHRFNSAALDALRQLGVHTAGRQVERKRWLLNGWGWNAAGYWLVRQSRKKSATNQQRFLPTLVLIDGKSGAVSAWVSGMEEMRPYHEVLLSVGQGALQTFHERKEIATRLPQDLDRLGFNQDVVLVVDTTQSSMRHNIWRWLQDSKISADEIEFNDGQKWYSEDRPNLRVVRTRNVKHETPEWYAESDRIGLSAGLHKVNERVFASTSPTATTQQFNRGLTKTDTANASKSTPTPGFYELTVGMMQPGDNAEEIATIVHDLRDASAQYADETAHALPLHLGKLIEEYLLWIEDEEEDEEQISEE